MKGVFPERSIKAAKAKIRYIWQRMAVIPFSDPSPLKQFDLGLIFGWISIACWIVVYTPQIWMNFRLKSGEGISIIFVIIWLAGDLTNFVGAILQNLLPTLIILAVWYSLCDIVLLFQFWHYRRLRRLHPGKFPPLPSDLAPGGESEDSNNGKNKANGAGVGGETGPEGQGIQGGQGQITIVIDPATPVLDQGEYGTSDERTPLLSSSSDPNDQQSITTGSAVGATKVIVTTPRRTNTCGRFCLYFLYLVITTIIVVIAIFAFIGLTSRPNNIPHVDPIPAPAPSPPKNDGPAGGQGGEKWNTTAQVIGWISAFLYLASRIPQIIKNTTTKCEGLALGLFVFSVLGNITYVLSIVVPQTVHATSTPNSPYLLHVYINLPWLVGSGGTIFLDSVIFFQFIWYRKERRAVELEREIEVRKRELERLQREEAREVVVDAVRDGTVPVDAAIVQGQGQGQGQTIVVS